MKHMGDICRISGRDVPPVEVIIGGSPCQDLSVAGKRAGISGARSGLFMEQIRIIKEMRAKDAEAGRTGTDIRPRFMVWENVPGAFSVNEGRDFAAVLEETARVVEEEIPDILPPRNGWTYSGCYMGNGWSIAWRVLDAQFWGVPQRRRRIALVADFAGECAAEILFERCGLPWDSEQSGTAWEGTAEDAEEGAPAAVCYGETGISHWKEGIQTLRAEGESRASRPSHVVISGFPLGFRPENVRLYPETSTTLCNGTRPGFTNGVCWWDGGQTAGTITSRNAGGAQRMPDKDNFTAVCAVDFMNGTEDADTNGTIQARSSNSVNANNTIRQNFIVRRLTPLECERLQGFPDGWTDIGEWTDSKGKKHKDSDAPRYKALGNSIAIPPWLFVCERVNQYCKEHTMASLFDGIGGFPLIWEFLNGKGSAVWASEIEEFCIAVAKRRFPE